MANMEALQFSFKERKLELNKIPIPEVRNPYDVLIKVAYAGICGTDLHILAGEFPCRQSTAITLGHEICGTIVEVGPNVIHFRKDDQVAIDPNSGCKRCTFCHAGKPHFCKLGCGTNTIGIFKDGGWAQYVLCPEEQVHKLPPKMTIEQAVLAEPLSCIAHGWDISSPLTIGNRILLLGAGITGALWTCVLHLHGHRNVVISEPNTIRLQMLRKLNTGYKMVTPEQLRKHAERDPECYSFDVVIDCSGDVGAIEQGFSMMNSGGKLVVYGVAPPANKISISPYDIFRKEITIMGVRTNPFTFKKALDLIESLSSRYLSFTALGVKPFLLSEYKEAIDTLKKGTIMKAVFRM
ncbi:D-arabinitol dehydrogenase 1-like [Tribolium madens]|uniref:D-arabinitol dehydrogenase 1-like n=1 Tax=Tribolium madens TaxID=41895 RepID=UPI001CF737DF|nr:D-arabinitol dehydrogenase 1-like [Tribolium madens]